MYKVASSQFGYWFGKQLYYPYSIAVLISYLNKFQEIRDAFEFLPCAVDRASVYAYVEAHADADILLCSCYNWNWEITQVLMSEMKRRNPECLVIAGGPQIPDGQEWFMHGWIDVAVHGEGEQVLKDLLSAWLNKEPLKSVAGATVRSIPGFVPEYRPAPLILNLDDIPSPYLDGTMHRLVDPSAATWIPTFETVRGCPHGCAFCAWGAASYDKVRQFGMERIKSEIDWFADNRVEYVECGDANFGMLARDTEITAYLKAKKLATGYPKTFKPSWSKKVTPRVIEIARELKSVDLLAAAGCSLQSLDPHTLKENKRLSATFDEFTGIVSQFKQWGAQTFTEIIRGLPGETLESFKAGLDKVVFGSNVDTVYIYNCTVLENTELKARGFKTAHVPLYFTHTSVNAEDVTEYEDLILESESFTRDDLEAMYLYSWYMLAFQQMGILNYIAKYLHRERGVEYAHFFARFEEYCKANPDGLFGCEYAAAKQYIKDGYDGKGWNHADATLGNVFYPIDEQTWLRVTRNRDALWDEIEDFLIDQFGTARTDLTRFQLFTLANRENPATVNGRFAYDWLAYFNGGELIEREMCYEWMNKIPDAADDYDWNARAVWYGRRKVAYRARLEDIREQK